MGADANIVGMWERMSAGGGVAVAAHRCVVVRNRHASCRRCVDACPAGAIVQVDGVLEVRPECCDACGACADACPTEAIMPAGAKAPAAPSLRPYEVPSDVVRVRDDGTLPHFVPERRSRLLARLAAGEDLQDADLEGQHWGQVRIDVARCESCRMCAVFCPTGALTRYEDGDTFGLMHMPALCVHCGACTDVCYTGALELSAGVQRDALASREVQRIPLEPLRYERGGPHSTAHALRYLLGTQALYER